MTQHHHGEYMQHYLGFLACLLNNFQRGILKMYIQACNTRKKKQIKNSTLNHTRQQQVVYVYMPSMVSLALTVNSSCNLGLAAGRSLF